MCVPAPVVGTSRCRGVYDLVQLRRHIQENAKEQAHPEALSLQSIDLQEPYVAVVNMDMIWSMAAPTAEDRQMEGGTPYNYVHNVSSIILARHGDADNIICLNDSYDAAYSTKDDERDLWVQGKAHIPNTYMNLTDPSPVPER